MTTPKLFIMAGIPGCGKSTWARRFFPTHRIVSSDAIREELWPGEEYSNERNAKTFEVYHDRILDKLPYGDLVADATSLRMESRLQLTTIAKACEAEAHLVLFTNIEQATARNLTREGNALVPLEAMEVMCKKYYSTLSEVDFEGYDSITYIAGTS